MIGDMEDTRKHFLIVDDDPLVRSALSLMLGGQPDVRVVGEAPDGRAGIAAARDLRPDVVLMDIRMPVLDGLAATIELRQSPEPLARHRADHLRRRRLRAPGLAAGADGFLLKDTPPTEILDVIRRVAAGDPMLSPSVTRTLIQQVAPPDSSRSSRAQERLDCLTDRERDVALAVGRGLSNAEIAGSSTSPFPR